MEYFMKRKYLIILIALCVLTGCTRRLYIDVYHHFPDPLYHNIWFDDAGYYQDSLYDDH